MTTALLVCAVLLALVYTFLVGVQDVSNAVATAVATRSLEVRAATAVAAAMAFAGTLAGWGLGLVVPDTSGIDVAAPPPGDPGLAVLAVVLAAAGGWLLVMARAGMPVSTSHTLVAAMVGAAWATGVEVDWRVLGTSVVAPMVACAVAALVIGWAGTRLARRVAMGADSATVVPAARVLQALASTATAMFIGLLGSSKSIVVVCTALALAGQDLGDEIPAWVVLASGAALAAGMVLGGGRIIATMSELMVGHAVSRGALLQAASGGAIGVLALGLGVPVSTTHTIGSALIGSGIATPGRMRWRLARRVLLAWLATVPVALVGAGLLAGIAYRALTAV